MKGELDRLSRPVDDDLLVRLRAGSAGSERAAGQSAAEAPQTAMAVIRSTEIEPPAATRPPAAHVPASDPKLQIDVAPGRDRARVAGAPGLPVAWREG